MKKPHFIILGVSALLLALIFIAIYMGGSSLVVDVAGEDVSQTNNQTRSGLVGNRLPYFTLPSLTGDRVRSTDFTDTPLVLVFWATWNSSSADELHIIDQYLTSDSSNDRLVRIVSVNSQEEKSLVSAFMHRGGYSVETLIDSQGLVSQDYDIKSLPTFFFVDRSGVVQEIYTGALSQSKLMNKIENIVQ